MTADDLPPPRRRILGDVKLAWSFLTCVPMRGSEVSGGDSLSDAAWAVPLVGAGVGLCGWYAYAGGALVGLPSGANALLALAAMYLVTGGLHADGLADTADGLGGRDRARRLEIMRDSRIGAYGVMALILVIGMDTAAIVAIDAASDGHLMMMACLIAPATLSRCAMLFVMKLFPRARADGLGAWAGRPGWAGALGATVVTLVVGVFPLLGYGWWLAPAVIGAGAAAAAVVGLAAARALGGYTGDVLGAVQQVSEMAMLLAASATLTHASPG